MKDAMKPLEKHVKTGLTTLCRCWAIIRKDGETFGFTDHDCSLSFGGVAFKADSGLSASTLEQSTGLSVDNSEALGALSDASVREEDIEAGRFDGAEVMSWLVNWADPEARQLQFRGSIGQLRRGGGAFHAELRGLTEDLNRPLGRVFQKPCTAVLGDVGCAFDLSQPGYTADIEIEEVEEDRIFRWSALPGFEPGWFKRGRLDVLSGKAGGLWGLVKKDELTPEGRRLELWEPLKGGVAAGQTVRLSAGCDKRMETCRLKFNNLLNFQGFPDLPSEDWVMAVPRKSGSNTGGSLR